MATASSDGAKPLSPIPTHKCAKTAPMPKTLDSGATPKDLAIQVSTDTSRRGARFDRGRLTLAAPRSRHPSGWARTSRSCSTPSSHRTAGSTRARSTATSRPRSCTRRWAGGDPPAASSRPIAAAGRPAAGRRSRQLGLRHLRQHLPRRGGAGFWPLADRRAARLKALKYGYRTHISNCGALVTMSGHRDAWKTGRSPKDKRVVREPSTQDDIWWAKQGSGSPNYEMDDRWGSAALVTAARHAREGAWLPAWRPQRGVGDSPRRWLQRHGDFSSQRRPSQRGARRLMACRDRHPDPPPPPPAGRSCSTARPRCSTSTASTGCS